MSSKSGQYPALNNPPAKHYPGVPQPIFGNPTPKSGQFPGQDENVGTGDDKTEKD